MKNNLQNYIKRKVTFMFVPHEGGKPVHVKFQLPLLHAAVLILVAILGWALWIESQDVRDAELLAQARRMKEQMEDIQREMRDNQASLERMAKLDSQFRQILRLKNARKMASLPPLGGPTGEDSEQLTQLLKEKDTEFLDKISLGLKAMNQEALRREASFREIQVQIDHQRSVIASTPSIWPVKGWITSGFGKRMSPLTGEPGRHMGVDIANETNTPIRATADGMVTYAGWEGGYGRLVVIEHGYGFSTRYGHCSRLNVKVGDEVKQGQVIGYIGSTGNSTGSHCHYEVRIHGMAVDPMQYLPVLN